VPAYQPRVAALIAETLPHLWRRLAEAEDLSELEHLVREVGLLIARGVAEIVLECLDRLLSRERPAGWREKDVRTRTLESIDKVLATRMGKRGMAWTPAGARRMGKVLQACRNDELERHLTAAAPQRGRHAEEPAIRPLRRQAATAIAGRSDPQDWLRASVATATGTDGFGPLLRRIARPAGFAVN